MSLCLLTMLSVKEYATLLILANLVSAMNTWQPMLVEHDLHNHRENLAEATRASSTPAD